MTACARSASVVLCLACVAASPAPAGRAAGPRFLYPPDRSVARGTVDVIVAAPRSGPPPALKLDSQQARLTRLRFSPTWLMPGAIARTAERIGDRAEADLWLGQVTGKRARRLTVGSEQRTVFIGERGPAGWYQARAHGPVPSEPGRHRCSGCHEMADGKLGPAPTPRACETCHSDVAVQTIHRHVTPPLARCGLCHDPHGATRPKLLTDAREKLCTRCHPGGHSKG